MSPETEGDMSQEATTEFQDERMRVVIEALKTGSYEAMGVLQGEMLDEAPDASGQIRTNIIFARMYIEAGLFDDATEALEDTLMYAENMGDSAAISEIEQLLGWLEKNPPEKA
jgi:hypothetical protein